MEEDDKTEQRKSRSRAILRLAGIVAPVALGLMVIVVAICWFAGWCSAMQIGSGLTWVGVAAIAVRVLSTIGGWRLTRDPTYMYAQSVSQQSMTTLTRQGLGDSLHNYNFAIVTTAAGLLCIAGGALL